MGKSFATQKLPSNGDDVQIANNHNYSLPLLRGMPNKVVQMANNHNGEIIYYVQPASTLAMMVMMSFSGALQSYRSW